ncbi:hypothetical protein TSUD_167230 [Trifolium subterraneum]|nr:hypothetical protein TSUD_167230 [Trifolium subterraneum]
MAMAMGVCVSSIFKFSSVNYNKSLTVAVLQKKEKKMTVPYNLKEGQSRIFHKLPSGLNMEVIVQKKKKEESRNGESDEPEDTVAGTLQWTSLAISHFEANCCLQAKGFQSSLSLCRETFFSATMEDHVVKRYQELMKESSRMPLFDLRKLNASLPVPSVPNLPLEVLVLGANNDFIVDAEGLKETAEFYGVSPVCIEGVAHDMMLDTSWDKGAEVIISWLNILHNFTKLQAKATKEGPNSVTEK